LIIRALIGFSEDRFFPPFRSLSLVHVFIRQSMSTAVFFATQLTLMYLSYMERKESAIQKLSVVPFSDVRQCQTSFLSVVEDNKHYSSFKLLYVVVESVYLFGLRLVLMLYSFVDTYNSLGVFLAYYMLKKLFD
jgi:hypothetical protein